MGCYWWLYKVAIFNLKYNINVFVKSASSNFEFVEAHTEDA